MSKDRLIKVLKDVMKMDENVQSSDLHILLYNCTVDTIEEYNIINKSSIPTTLGFHIATEVMNKIDPSNYISWVNESRSKRTH